MPQSIEGAIVASGSSTTRFLPRPGFVAAAASGSSEVSAAGPVFPGPGFAPEVGLPDEDFEVAQERRVRDRGVPASGLGSSSARAAAGRGAACSAAAGGGAGSGAGAFPGAVAAAAGSGDGAAAAGAGGMGSLAGGGTAGLAGSATAGLAGGVSLPRI